MMKSNPQTKKWWFTASAAAVLGLLLAVMMAEPRDSLAAGTGKAAPDWALKNVDGKTVKLSDYKGKVVILDFWATWCPPCRAEIPSFVELYKKYSQDGLVVVGVSVDEEGPSVVKPFIKRNKIEYPIVMADGKIEQAYGGVEAIPTTFIINREGKIVNKHVGLTSKEEFEKEIKPLLKRST